MVQPLWKTVWHFLKKHTLTVRSSNCAPWLPKRMENLYLHKNLHTNVYSTLFIIDKTYKQSRCPSVDDWINNRDIQATEYYLAHKKEVSIKP